MNPTTTQALQERYLPALEREMREVVSTPSPAFRQLYGHLHYHLGWADEQLQPSEEPTGKRLRPIFCLLCCELCGGDWERALPAAAAVELLHNFSLIHDDIEDGDTTRRGRPTVWALWSMPQALNAGDALHALAHLALLRLADRGLPAETVAAAMQVFGRACLRLTQGQFLDIRFEAQESVAIQEYLEMVAGKTAALLAASCELGAMAANGEPVQREHLRDFGHHVGLAFQIEDDILGIWGDPEVTGKPAGSDIRRRKKTLPIIYGLQRSKPLQALLAQPDLSTANIAQAVELLEEAGGREWAQEEAQVQTRHALTALDAADGGKSAADTLRDLALGLVGRAR